MHRTEGTNHSGNLFVDGPPGTTVEEDFLNAVQEELCYAIEQAGLTLKTAATETRQQLKAGIDALADTRIDIADLRRKNAIINGGMKITQRATTWDAGGVNPANNDGNYVLDRWILLSDGNDIVDVTQSTEMPFGALKSIALDVETINKKFGILQIIGQHNCHRMIGGNVSLSFQAKVSDIAKLDNIKAMVIAWDGAADTVTSDVVSAWNAEDVTPTLVANWTAENVPVNLDVTATWAKYTIPAIAIDTAGAKNIGVFIWSDGFSDTPAKFLYITDVQLEIGDVATPFEFRMIEEELILCQGYYCKSYGQGINPGTATPNGAITISMTALANADYTAEHSVHFSTEIHKAPTITLYDFAGNAGKVTMAAGNNIVGTASQIAQSGFLGGGTNGAVSTSRILSFHYTADAEL